VRRMVMDGVVDRRGSENLDEVDHGLGSEVEVAHDEEGGAVLDGGHSVAVEQRLGDGVRVGDADPTVSSACHGRTRRVHGLLVAVETLNAFVVRHSGCDGERRDGK